MEEADKYSEYEICKICQKCQKFLVICAGKNAAIYADSSESCWNFVKQQNQNKKGRKK